jgi:hypothetical protein
MKLIETFNGRKSSKKSKIFSLILIEVLVELAYALIWTSSFQNNIFCDYVRFAFRSYSNIPSSDENSHSELFFYKFSSQSNKLDYTDKIEIIFSLILDFKTILFIAILARWYLIGLSVKRLLKEKEVFY